MKQIQKDELFAHLSGFLKEKGIELKAGSYSNLIHNGCNVLADAVNLSQRGIERAKSGLDEKLDRMRQVIHEKTAPKPAGSAGGATAAPSPSAPAAEPAPANPAPASAAPAASEPPAPAKVKAVRKTPAKAKAAKGKTRK